MSGETLVKSSIIKSNYPSAMAQNRSNSHMIVHPPSRQMMVQPPSRHMINTASQQFPSNMSQLSVQQIGSQQKIQHVKNSYDLYQNQEEIQANADHQPSEEVEYISRSNRRASRSPPRIMPPTRE